MALTTAQLITLKAAIASETDPTFVALRQANETGQMAAWYNNLTTSPSFYCWRTNVSRAEIYNTTSAELTTWSWTFYKNQAVAEQNSWTQMFMDDKADMSQPNLRTGIAAIFTSASAVNATHALAVGKRVATKGERVFATGTGTIAIPGVFGYQGAFSNNDVLAALQS